MRLEEFEAKADRAKSLICEIRTLKDMNIAPMVDVRDFVTSKPLGTGIEWSRIVKLGVDATVKELEAELARIFGDPGPCDHCQQHECHCPTLHIHD